MTFAINAKIVIVDDLPDMRRALADCLRRLGYANVIACTDGGEALGVLVKESDVTLVISDWNMEPVDGLGLLAGMRRDPRLKGLPFILVSAEAGPFRRNQAMEAGVSLFMAKPFGIEALRDALATVHAGHRTSGAA
jgi:two-component system, chemotaxis family, chemotaxis protein CheY